VPRTTHGAVGAEEDAGGLFARFAGDLPDGPDPAGVRLFCFPYAGAGGQVFRPWQKRFGPRVAVTGVRLPGRETRFGQRPYDNWPQVTAALTAAFAPEAGRGPYAFFGHSLGARLAYELAHLLVAAGLRPPELLVVSACRAPGVPARWPDMHSMDTPTLTERLRVMRGVPEEVLANRRMMALLEPVLRADLRIAETWEPSGGRLPVPVLALCGEQDDIDPHEDMLGWAGHTTGEFAIHTFPAGHFFLHEREEAVVAAVAARLDAGAAR
jgi:medium-chain acyl-[acyl-carrier-protein] hydrolase